MFDGDILLALGASNISAWQKSSKLEAKKERECLILEDKASACEPRRVEHRPRPKAKHKTSWDFLGLLGCCIGNTSNAMTGKDEGGNT